MHNFRLFTKRVLPLVSTAAQKKACIFADNNEQQDETLLDRLMNGSKEHDARMREPLVMSLMRSRRR